MRIKLDDGSSLDIDDVDEVAPSEADYVPRAQEETEITEDIITFVSKFKPTPGKGS